MGVTVVSFVSGLTTARLGHDQAHRIGRATEPIEDGPRPTTSWRGCLAAATVQVVRRQREPDPVASALTFSQTTRRRRDRQETTWHLSPDWSQEGGRRWSRRSFSHDRFGRTGTGSVGVLGRRRCDRLGERVPKHGHRCGPLLHVRLRRIPEWRRYQHRYPSGPVRSR